MFFFGRFYAHWFDDTSELALKSPAQVYGRMGRRIAVWKFCVGFSAALHSTVMMEMGWKWQEDTTRLTSFVVKLDKLSEDASQVLYIDSNFLSQFMRGFKISFYFSELHSHNVWKLSKNSKVRPFSKCCFRLKFNFGHHTSLYHWLNNRIPFFKSRLTIGASIQRTTLFCTSNWFSFAMPYPETVGAKTHCAKMEFIWYWLQE